MPKSMRLFTMLAATIFIFVTCIQHKDDNTKSTALISNHARPLIDTTIAASPGRLERGRYLANGVLRCFYCHTQADTTKAGWPPLADKLGSGRLLLKTDSTYVYAPNITPDKETGAGNWTDDMLVRAIRNGIGHDGRALYAMPWWIFQKLSDEDLASVVVYLQSLPSVKNKLPQRALTEKREKELQDAPRPMEYISMAPPDTSTVIAKGRYLVTMGECEGCHTAWYKRNPGYFGGGNIIANDDTDSVIVSANISPDITGIGGWDDETFIRVMKTGKAGSLHHSMPWTAFRNISDEDLKAMLAALNTLPPVEHRIVNGMKPTLCEVCGEKHGYGDHNKIVPIATIKANLGLYSSYAGDYINEELGKATVRLKDKKLWISIEADGGKELELLPVAEHKFAAAGLPSAIIFQQDKTGKIISFSDYDLVPLTFTKTPANK